MVTNIASRFFPPKHAQEIAREEAPRRGISEDLALKYLTRHIVYELHDRDYQGMKLYLESAQRLDRVTIAGSVPA